MDKEDKAPAILLFLDDIKVWRRLNDQQLGQLMHAIEQYFNDGKETQFEDVLLTYAYETHKTTIQRHKDEYERKIEANKKRSIAMQGNQNARKHQPADDPQKNERIDPVDEY